MVGVDIEQYDDKNPSKYLRGLLRDSDYPNDPVAQRAYESYLGIVPSSPVGFENFTVMVNNYMEKPPFSFPNPLSQFGGGKLVRRSYVGVWGSLITFCRLGLKLLICTMLSTCMLRL